VSRKNYQNARGKGKGRHIINEDELFLQLRKLGFERYAPEELPIPDQIELFYDAEMVVGAHGSALTNILFSEGIKVLELNPVRAVHPYFYLLSKCIGGKHQFWFPAGGHNEPEPDGALPDDAFQINFTVEVQEIVDLVSKALAD
jgi:capsular polysaccharide biosynthesis protein